MTPLSDPIIGSDLDSLVKRPGLERLKDEKIMITGGAGFLGSWLCDTLVSSGCIVHCVDNLSTGVLRNIEHLSDRGNFAFQNHDVTEPNLGDERYDLVAHFASHASPEEYQQRPIETLAVNSEGTRNMLELARKSDAPLVYASTSEVYGNPEIIPTPESYWGNVNPIGLRSCYDEGKRFGEALCMAYYRVYGLDVRIVRIFNTYGPRLRPDGLYGRVVSKFIEQALMNTEITVYGEGNQTRSFCYVTDTVAGVLRAATRQEMKGEVVNIGSPQEITILQLAEKIKATARSKSKITFRPLQPDDPQRRCPNISKAKRILGWSPNVGLEDGLGKTVEWFAKDKRGR